MNRQSKILTTLLGASLLLLGAYFFTRPKTPQAVQSALVRQPAGLASGTSSAGFTRAEGPIELNFPADHGAHPDFQTEWWYYTGNLATPDGRRFGYQLTFFRRALLPPSQVSARPSDWSSNQVFMAHFALSDIGGETFHAEERLERGAAGLAGAQSTPFQVWLNDWRVTETVPGSYQLVASQPTPAGWLELKLDLVDRKGPILQGDRGYSQKGPQPGNASYYVSLTRLETSGEVILEDVRYPVQGLSWMDHEWSTSALSADQVGWDWFSIQLENGAELMLFQIRKADGSLDPYSAGTFIGPDGATRQLSLDDLNLEVLDRWTSPRTQASYPAGWRLSIPSLQLELEIQPHQADQELDVSYAYWEGAIRVTGRQAGAEVQGHGYAELTGYAGSMAGEF
jgi:predicted secreted hydrolase